ncbi:DUF4231 domain-containing protein [Nocardia sputorum]|nr:DUF4231 domain-containing protein [Nocardia sputorum]
MYGQKFYLRAYGARLWLAVVAAACAAFTVRVGSSGTDIAAILTAMAFVGILAVDVGVLRSRPGKSWYEGRALAESVKTLTWKYAVQGAPFVGTLSPAEADRMLIDRIRLLRQDISALALRPTTAPAISDRMRQLRSAPFDERRRVYLDDRIREQQRWYATKSDYHQRRSQIYGTMSLVFEVAGVAGALAKAFNAVNFDLAGIFAAAVAGLAAWSSARQHSTAAAAYAVASNELSIVAEVLEQNHTEGDWAVAVSDAEEAISREHTLWRASHGE